jgi:23S rRNA (uridine2552-2'-O)-methyltransferase
MKKFNPRDYYFKKAKELDYKARSVFKLEEIDQKWKLIKPGQVLLDLGSAPGSWSQFVLRKWGAAQGLLVGVDLKPTEIRDKRFYFLQRAIEDLVTSDWASWAGTTQLDGVLSDMAPATSGIKSVDQARSLELGQLALNTAISHLKEGGFFVVKIFEGPETKDFVAELKRCFLRVELYKPQSTRSISKEIFLIGLKFKAST